MPPTNLALEYVNRGDYKRAFAEAERALSLDPKEANAWDNYGLALFHLGRYAEAEAAFRRAVELEPESALFWSNLAGALREQGRLDEAERLLLDRALSLDPILPAAHLNLGTVYLLADRPDLAAIHLQEAARLLSPELAGEAVALLEESRQPERWLRLGDLLLANGDPEGALNAFEQAGVLGARPQDVAVGQSAALIELGELLRAKRVLEEGLANAPEDARLHNNLGVVAREMGDKASAAEHFRRAIELAPDWPLPRQNLEALEEEDV
jgi:Flp pilus assembly protein TadD